jgi:beta-glucanase (GH16 family)
VSGAWPAWWTLGHAADTPQGSSSWGPEIDIVETNDTKSDLIISTLHGSRTPSNCFLRGGGNPPGRAETPAARYEAHPWNMGDFEHRPGNDFAQGFHRFGARIAPNYNISIWVDDHPIGTFAAEQYADDAGKPVGVQLLVNLALGTHNPDPVRSIHTADFGGANNRGPSNKFRFGLKTIQIWGP